MTQEPNDPNTSAGQPAPPSPEPTPEAVPGAQPAAQPTAQPDAAPDDAASHRLMRSRSERVFGGIAGGLAEYFDFDPVLMRIAFVILAIVTKGAFVLLYFAAWIIIPEEAPLSAGAGAPASTPRRHAARRRHAGPGAGALVLGFLLILVGAFSLLWTLGLRVPPFDAILAGLLILVGLAIIVESRRGVHGGLIAIALILTAILGTAATTVPDLHFDSGFGDRTVRPAARADLESSYSHAFGDMVVDLRNVDFPEGETTVHVSVAFGSTEIYVPANVAVRVTGETVFGSTDALGREFSGISVNHDASTPDFQSAPRRVTIDLSNAFGSAVLR